MKITLKFNLDNGFSSTALVACLVVIIGLVIIFIAVSHIHSKPASSANSSAPTTSSSAGSSTYTVLPPATVPPKVAECNQAISFASNGTSGPISCGNGELNATEWKALSALEPSVMSLGYNVTTSQVQSVICADTGANIPNPIEEINYQIASIYYGWSFSSDPSIVLTNGTCVNQDD